MHRFRHGVIEPLIDALGAPVVLDLDDGSGRLADGLARVCRDRGATLHVAHPQPRFDIAALEDAGGGSIRVHRAAGERVAFDVGDVDLALIHADPNWYTVSRLLAAVEDRASRDERELPVILVHGVRWPFGRRDAYADPASIPHEARHPAARDGVVPGRSALASDGLDTGLYNALADYGARNGVRAALDDWAEGSTHDLTIIDLPGMGGLAVVASADAIAAHEPLRAFVDHLRSADFHEDHARQVDGERVRIETQLDGVTRELRAQREAVAEALVEIEAERAARAGAEASAGLEAERLRAEARAFAERADALATELHAAGQRIAALEHDVAVHERAAAGARTEHDRLREAAAASELAAAVAEARQTALQRSADAIERELRDARARLEQQLATNEQERLQLRVEVARRDLELEQLRAERSVLSTRVEQDAARVADTVIEVERLRDQLDRERESRQALERRSETLQRELESRDAELEATRDQERLLIERVSELADARDQAAELESRLTREQDARLRLTEQRDRARSDVERALASRSWRLGHRTTIWMRRLTFRRPQGEDSALDRALDTLAQDTRPAELSPPSTGHDLSPILRSAERTSTDRGA